MEGEENVFKEWFMITLPAVLISLIFYESFPKDYIPQYVVYFFAIVVMPLLAVHIKRKYKLHEKLNDEQKRALFVLVCQIIGGIFLLAAAFLWIS